MIDVDVVFGSVNDVVVCDNVDVTSVVVVTGDEGVAVVAVGNGDIVVVVSGFLGARMTKFNSRDRVIAKIVKTIKEMQIILNQR